MIRVSQDVPGKSSRRNPGPTVRKDPDLMKKSRALFGCFGMNKTQYRIDAIMKSRGRACVTAVIGVSGSSEEL